MVNLGGSRFRTPAPALLLSRSHRRERGTRWGRAKDAGLGKHRTPLIPTIIIHSCDQVETHVVVAANVEDLLPL